MAEKTLNLTKAELDLLSRLVKDERDIVARGLIQMNKYWAWVYASRLRVIQTKLHNARHGR